MAKRRALRFSMGTLLFFVLCVSGYLAGHKQGYRDGKALWDIMPVYHQVYLASDLLDVGQRRLKPNLMKSRATSDARLCPRLGKMPEGIAQ